MLATVTNKAVPVTVHKAGNTPVVAPTLIGPTTVQHLRSVTSTVVDSQISKNNTLVACIAHLSNTMAQHSQHRPQGPYPINPGTFLPLE